MILTKGIIVQTPSDNNIFRVEIPLMGDNTTNEAIFNAVMSGPPGSYNGYEVGDVVIVHFEDEELNNPIILGKLFTGIPENNSAYILANQLKVTNNVELPANTTIGGIRFKDIGALVNNADNVIGGGGQIDEDTLEDFVRWEATQRDAESYFANKIRVCSGEEYDAILSEASSISDFDSTLFFLTSPPRFEYEEG